MNAARPAWDSGYAFELFPFRAVLFAFGFAVVFAVDFFAAGFPCATAGATTSASSCAAPGPYNRR